MKRDASLDVLRGLMLMVMTIDHFGGPIADITRQTIGFVSGAEGFVFLSGFISGIVYGEYARRDPGLMVQKAYKRASVIYSSHVALLVSVGLLFLANRIFAEYWTPLAPLFHDHAIKAFLLGIALLYQPRFLDILPMYVVFLLTVPFLIRQFKKGRAPIVLSVSALLWLSAQFHVRAYLLDGFAHDAGIYLGYFDIFAWQLLFVVGSWFGYRRTINSSASTGNDTAIIWSFFIVVVAFFLVKHGYVVIPGLDTVTAADRGTLAWLRLINFSAIVLFVGALTRKYNELFKNNWLAFLGQHSLQVFSYHIVILYLIMPVRWRIEDMGGLAEVAVCLAYVASLTLPAKMHQSYRRRIAVRNTLAEAQ